MSIIIEHKKVYCDMCKKDITNDRFYEAIYRGFWERALFPFFRNQICADCWEKMKGMLAQKKEGV